MCDCLRWHNKRMETTRIASFDDLRCRMGEEIAVGDWHTIGQEAIDRFAEATGDHQWIHVDPERAARESPFGGAVAHGFLTASLLPRLLAEALELPPVRMGVNYGFNRLRFTSPVCAGARVRARFTLGALEDVPGGVQMTWNVSVDIEGSDKPALVAQWLTRRYT